MALKDAQVLEGSLEYPRHSMYGIKTKNTYYDAIWTMEYVQ